MHQRPLLVLERAIDQLPSMRQDGPGEPTPSNAISIRSRLPSIAPSGER
jgi:hypothetical protein